MDYSARSRLTLWRLLGWGLTLAAFWYIGRWMFTQDRSVWRIALELQPGWLAVALGLFLVWFYLRAMAWDRISRLHGFGEGQKLNLRMWSQSELMRYVPGNIWSLAARYRGATAGGVSRGGSAQALALEALLQLAGAAIVAGWFWLGGWWKAAALGLFAALPFILPKLLPRFWKLLRRTSILPTVAPNDLNILIGLYTLIWLIFGVANAALYFAFPDLPLVGISGLIGLNVAAWLIGFVSFITPMGLGVREVVIVKMFAPVVASGPASIVAVVSRLWLIVSEIVFFLIASILGRKKR